MDGGGVHADQCRETAIRCLLDLRWRHLTSTQVVNVYGPAQCGKTRLMAEFCKRIASRCGQPALVVSSSQVELNYSVHPKFFPLQALYSDHQLHAVARTCKYEPETHQYRWAVTQLRSNLQHSGCIMMAKYRDWRDEVNVTVSALLTDHIGLLHDLSSIIVDYTSDRHPFAVVVEFDWERHVYDSDHEWQLLQLAPYHLLVSSQRIDNLQERWDVAARPLAMTVGCSSYEYITSS